MERQELLQGLGAQSEGVVVRGFGQFETEYTALETGIGILELSHRDHLIVEGADTASYLNRLLSYDVASMEPGHGARPFLLDVRGRILLTFNLFRVDSDRFVIDASQDHGEAVCMRLDMFHFGERIQWKNEKSGASLISLQGPGATACIEALGISVPAEPWHNASARILESSCTIARVDRTESAGYDLMVSDRDFEPVWNVLMKAGATPVGLDALEARRIAAGIPGHPNELGEHSGPLEAGGMDGITDGKGCYPGQEVIERTLSLGRPPRVLVPVELGSHGEVGVLTGESEKSTGELTSVVTLPDGSVIGLALVKQAALAAKQWYRDGVSVRPRGED